MFCVAMCRRRLAAEAVPHGGVGAQIVLRVGALLRLRAAVGGEGVREPRPRRPHAERAAGHHVPGAGGAGRGGAVRRELQTVRCKRVCWRS